MRIGEYIKYRRRLLSYTQQQLANRLSISKQAVNKWEKCLSVPDIMILPELGFILKKSPHFLTEIIWRGNYEGDLTHFIFLTVLSLIREKINADLDFAGRSILDVEFSIWG